MPREFKRTDRVADAIKRELSQLIQFELRDPRIGMVNITDVEVTRDLAHAKVFVTFVGEDEAKGIVEATEALNKASGYLRTCLAKILNIRTTPKVRFIYDESVVRGQNLSALIDKAVAADNHSSTDKPGDGEA